MKLMELKISIEMCSINDKHILMISEALEKNKSMKILSLSFWKYAFLYLVIKSHRVGLSVS